MAPSLNNLEHRHSPFYTGGIQCSSARRWTRFLHLNFLAPPEEWALCYSFLDILIIRGPILYLVDNKITVGQCGIRIYRKIIYCVAPRPNTIFTTRYYLLYGGKSCSIIHAIYKILHEYRKKTLAYDIIFYSALLQAIIVTMQHYQRRAKKANVAVATAGAATTTASSCCKKRLHYCSCT